MLTAGQQMVRVDDGMRGQVELVAMPGLLDRQEYRELRVVYFDRGEKRIAGKRERWEPVTAPSKKLRADEIRVVADVADHMLRCLDKNEPTKWWQISLLGAEPRHDPELVRLIVEHLEKRG